MTESRRCLIRAFERSGGAMRCNQGAVVTTAPTSTDG